MRKISGIQNIIKALVSISRCYCTRYVVNLSPRIFRSQILDIEWRNFWATAITFKDISTINQLSVSNACHKFDLNLRQPTVSINIWLQIHRGGPVDANTRKMSHTLIHGPKIRPPFRENGPTKVTFSLKINYKIDFL